MNTFQTEPLRTPHIPSSTADFPLQTLNINIRSSWWIVLQTANLLPQFQLLPGTTHTNRQQLLIREHSHIHDLDTPPPQSVLSIPLSLVMSKLLVWFLFLFLSLAGLKTKRICPFSGSLVLHAAVRTYLSPACVCVCV